MSTTAQADTGRRHNAASRWNKALLDNAARPSGALVYAAREGRLSPEQFERLKNELQDGFAGAKNAGRPLLLEGDLDWKPLSLTPAELDFLNAKHSAAREIASALGVPPQLLGIPGDNTYSNYAEANRAFWRQTILPLVQRTTKSLSAWLAPAYDATLRLVPDLDQVDALAPEREALWSRLNAATFLTEDEKRTAAGYGPNPGLKYRPDQPRDDAGRWVDDPDGGTDGSAPTGTVATFVVDAKPVADGGTAPAVAPPQADPSEWPTWDNPELIPVQVRQPTRDIRIGDRLFTVTQRQENDLVFSAARATLAYNRVRELDPQWRPTPELSAPQSAQGAIASYRALAQEAEARIQLIERGNLPLGFNSHGEYRTFGREVWSGLGSAGYVDAEPYLRGSAVTGHNYRTGTPFDQGPRPSDFDLAIASPSLMRRAQEEGIPIRPDGRTVYPLSRREIDALDLRAMVDRAETEAGGRKVSVMIYESSSAIVRRGPSVQVP